MLTINPVVMYTQSMALSSTGSAPSLENGMAPLGRCNGRRPFGVPDPATHDRPTLLARHTARPNAASSHRRLVFEVMAAGILGLVTVGAAAAQSQPGSIGIGGQIGDPSGVSLAVHDPDGMTYDFLAAWDLDDFLFLNVHGIFKRPLPEYQKLHFFYGPGGFIGIREHGGRDRDDDLEAGISATFGLDVFIEPFGLYVRITPRLSLIPDTDGEVGGGIGVRYYF